MAVLIVLREAYRRYAACFEACQLKSCLCITLIVNKTFSVMQRDSSVICSVIIVAMPPDIFRYLSSSKVTSGKWKLSVGVMRRSYASATSARSGRSLRKKKRSRRGARCFVKSLLSSVASVVGRFFFSFSLCQLASTSPLPTPRLHPDLTVLTFDLNQSELRPCFDCKGQLWSVYF